MPSLPPCPAHRVRGAGLRACGPRGRRTDTAGLVLPQGAAVTGPCTPAAPFPNLPDDPPIGLHLFHGDEIYTRVGLIESGPGSGYVRAARTSFRRERQDIVPGAQLMDRRDIVPLEGAVGDSEGRSAARRGGVMRVR